MKSLKVCAISDLHGHFPIIESCDILFIAGDISPISIQFNGSLMREWLLTKFTEWINLLPVKKVYFTPGNHDFYFQGLAKYKLGEFLQAVNYKLIFLENELVSYRCEDGKRFSIFGTPYCHIYGRWAYMREPDYLTNAFAKIPNEIDFLITHDAPYGIGATDVCLDHPRHPGQFDHIGNPQLRTRLDEIKYQWLIHGHLHTSNHEVEEYNGGKIVNVSLLDEELNFVFKPFYFEVEYEETGTEEIS